MLLSSLIKRCKMCQVVAAVALRGWRALGVHVVYIYVYFRCCFTDPHPMLLHRICIAAVLMDALSVVYIRCTSGKACSPVMFYVLFVFARGGAPLLLCLLLLCL